MSKDRTIGKNRHRIQFEQLGVQEVTKFESVIFTGASVAKTALQAAGEGYAFTDDDGTVQFFLDPAGANSPIATFDRNIPITASDGLLGTMSTDSSALRDIVVTKINGDRAFKAISGPSDLGNAVPTVIATHRFTGPRTDFAYSISDLPGAFLITTQGLKNQKDAIGGIIDNWENVATRWTNIKPVSGMQAFHGQALELRVSHMLIVRPVHGLTSEMRIKFGSRLFQIRYFREILERNKWMEIHCEEGAAS